MLGAAEAGLGGEEREAWITKVRNTRQAQADNPPNTKLHQKNENVQHELPAVLVEVVDALRCTCAK